MSDIISYGRDRDPRRPRRPRWRRWHLAAAAAALSVALAAAFIWWLPGPGPHGARTKPGAVGPAPATPAIPGSAAAEPFPLPTTPARMTGVPLPRDTSLRLLLGGLKPALLSVAANQTEPLRGLPDGGTSYQFTRLAHGWVAQPFLVADPACDNCAPASVPVYYVADGSRVANRVGADDITAPAATPGAVWLVSYQRGADMSTAAASAQEVGVTGTALGSPLRLPAGYTIQQGTRSGLLLVQAEAGPSELWDPGTRRVRSSFVNLIAAGPAEIAWMPACTATCSVHVLDLASGRVEEIALPGRSTGFGALSTDGQLLGLQVATGVARDGRPAATRLVVATVASGRIAAVPGTTVGSGIGVSFGWQAGSHQLIAALSLDTPGPFDWQIAVWRPGAARLSTGLFQMPDGSWPVVDQGPY